MEQIQWDDALSVGFEEIDNDHKRLVDLLNQLITAVAQGENKQQVHSIIAELISYTNWHFRHEERLMLTYGYPDYQQHKEEHEALKSQAIAFQNSADMENITKVADLTVFLKKWLTGHILKTDIKLGHYLAQKV